MPPMDVFGFRDFQLYIYIMHLPRMATDACAKKKELESLCSQLLSHQMNTIAGDTPSRTLLLIVCEIIALISSAKT